MQLACLPALIVGLVSQQVHSGLVPRENRAAECSNPIARSVLPDSFTIPAFGRDFQLGALYNAVTDTVIPSEQRICNRDTLQQLTRETKRLDPNPDIKVVQAKDWLTKVGVEWLDLPRNLQLSIATGLLNLTNEGRMLYQLPPTRTQVQTILSESHDWLSVALDDVAQPCGFYYTFLPAVTGATHYVSEIYYGYQRFAVLTKTLDLTSERAEDVDEKTNQAALIRLAMDIADGRDMRIPPLFARNLTAVVYRSGEETPLSYFNIFEFNKYFQKKDFLEESVRNREDSAFPIRVKLEKIPVFTEDIMAPVVSFPFYDTDLQMESDYADTLNSFIGRNFENYHRYAETFLSNFQQFRAIFMHHLRSAVYRHRTDSAEVEAAKSCDVGKLMAVRGLSPFSNYVSQVWTEILHRQLAKAEEFMTPLFRPSICPGRFGTACFVDVQFNFKDANAEQILTQQESFLWDFARNYTEVGLLLESQSSAPDSAKQLTDITWEGVSSKLDAVDSSGLVEKLVSLRESCDEQLEVAFSLNVETTDPKFVTFSLDGKCSENVQTLFDY